LDGSLAVACQDRYSLASPTSVTLYERYNFYIKTLPPGEGWGLWKEVYSIEI
jgi:hypothetical protein